MGSNERQSGETSTIGSFNQVTISDVAAGPSLYRAARSRQTLRGCRKCRVEQEAHSSCPEEFGTHPSCIVQYGAFNRWIGCNNSTHSMVQIHLRNCARCNALTFSARRSSEHGWIDTRVDAWLG